MSNSHPSELGADLLFAAEQKSSEAFVVLDIAKDCFHIPSSLFTVGYALLTGQ